MSGNKETLPCGCVIDVVGGAFIIKPCSETCQYYLYAIEQSKKRGNPIIMKRIPEGDIAG